MPHASLIEKYFPALSDKQKEQFGQLLELYPEWNSKINVISRKDIDNLETNHLLHSLGIARFIHFQPGTKIMDLGCGGGLPGIPLAIMNPECSFLLIDRTGKKIQVASEIAKALGLKNIQFRHGDAGEVKEKFDFVVSRAVMPQGDLVRLIRKNISAECHNALPNGLITLKGGELAEELRGLPVSETVELSRYFPEEPFFATKKLAYTPLV